jgi:hypothetical protein
MKTDEELLAAAEDLQARGELSVDRLRRVAGGGQRERLMAIVRRVREAAGRAVDPTAAEAAPGEPELPACLRDGLSRVAADMVRELVVVRTTELDRARAAEAAAAARHDAASRATETQIMLLNEDLVSCEAEVAELRSDVERLTGEVAQTNSASLATEELRRAEVARHSQERLALTQALSRVQDEAARLHEEAARQAGARSKAESDAAASSATASAAAVELERLRQDNAAVRAQYEALLRQLSSAETERDRALDDLRAGLGRPNVGAIAAPKAPARRHKRTAAEQ